MDKKEVPAWIVESTIVSHERTVKRLVILCLLIFLFAVLSNLAWVIREMQFEYCVVEESMEIEGESVVGIMGDGNEVTYGEGNTN